MRTPPRVLFVFVALVFALGGCNEKQRRETRDAVRGSGSTQPSDPNDSSNQ